MSVRVFLVDDHELVRRGLQDLLEVEDDMVVVGEAESAASAVERITANEPDVVVLDVRLPDGNGVEVCREVRSRRPAVACLMLTSYADDEALLAAIMAGAAGFVLKGVRGADLVSAIRRVAAGESLLDARDRARVMERLDRRRGVSRLGRLTAQEQKLLGLIGEGLTNRQIGESMFLAEKTVKNYVSSLLAKLGMSRRAEAAALAARLDERRSRGDGAGL